MGPLMHFTQKVATKATQSITTENIASDVPLFKNSVNGIVPGYNGHIPGSRDNYGQATVGGLSMEQWHGTHAGEAPRREKIGDVWAANSENKQFKAEQRGVLPGYSGFRKGAIEEYGVSSYGGVKPFASKEEHNNPATLAQGTRGVPEPKDPNEPPSFREGVHGTLPGYTGFVPNKHTKFGQSHWGNVGGQPSKAQGSPQALAPGARDKGDKLMSVDMRVKPGYSAHVPGARDSFGGSTQTTYNFSNNGY